MLLHLLALFTLDGLVHLSAASNLLQYSLHSILSQIFVARYQKVTYLVCLKD